MAGSLTLHTMDSVLEERLSSYARRRKKSLNQSAKELLASALGISAPQRTDHSEDLERFIGSWDDETSKKVRDNLENFSRIDEELWK